jgi:hypothetical protein
MPIQPSSVRGPVGATVSVDYMGAGKHQACPSSEVRVDRNRRRAFAGRDGLPGECGFIDPYSIGFQQACVGGNNVPGL